MVKIWSWAGVVDLSGANSSHAERAAALKILHSFKQTFQCTVFEACGDRPKFGSSRAKIVTWMQGVFFWRVLWTHPCSDKSNFWTQLHPKVDLDPVKTSTFHGQNCNFGPKFCDLGLSMSCGLSERSSIVSNGRSSFMLSVEAGSDWWEAVTGHAKAGFSQF